MRVIKVLFLLVFFFVCMLFFVQNTAILETALLLKLGAFGYMVQTPGVPFYVVLLLSFVAGGLFATLYFLAVDSEGTHETGDPQRWVAELRVRHQHQRCWLCGQYQFHLL